jgi:hypothetical protein
LFWEKDVLMLDMAFNMAHVVYLCTTVGRKDAGRQYEEFRL